MIDRTPSWNPLRAVPALLLIALVAACGDHAHPSHGGGAHADPAHADPAHGGGSMAALVEDLTVEAACGQCQFDLEGDGCNLAVRFDGSAYFVDGTEIDEHGDAHAEDGFCNAVRQARVSGGVEGERFVAESFTLLPEGDGAGS